MPRPNQATTRPTRHQRPTRRHGKQHERPAGERVAGRGDGLAVAQPVAPPAGPEFDEAGHGIGRAFDDAQRVDRGADDGQETGQHGGGHLVPGVAQQARQAHAEHVAVQPATGRRQTILTAGF